VEITWKTFVNVDKILVSFSNPTSSFPNDNRYQLTQFKSGDKTFLYRAFSQYNTLDYGTNEYLIEAYSWENVSKVEIIINVPNKEDSNSNNSNNSNNTSSNTNTSNIVSENYDITGLVITQLKPDLSVTTSDELNNFLTDNAWVKTWFYWNSLRPIQNGVWVSFYTIMLNVENYTYSKHYYIPDWTYWVLLLDTGTWIDKENIADKNAEFKDKNSDFDTTKADEYFKGLLNS
jgi:hypothetical protein